jgi:hypothetical protein
MSICVQDGLSKNALPVCLFTEKSHSLVSLWDFVNRFHSSLSNSIFVEIGRIENIASVSAHEELVPPKDRERVLAMLAGISLLSVEAELAETLAFAKDLSKDWQSQVTFGALVHSLKDIRRVMQSEMEKREFFCIPPPLNDYYEKEKPLGDAVYKAYPSARFDLTEAASCIACNRNVASAFHLMRAVEVGIRELGRDRQIQFALNGTIEFKQWGEIIRQLEDAVMHIQNWQNSHVKDEAHKFYNKALFEIRAFNDGWRRHAAHVRPHPEIETDEAIALWGHVSRFLGTLAAKISEGQYTPLVWI